MKKFYKTVSLVKLEDGYSVSLDEKPIKTPLKHDLVIPTKQLAEAIKGEWEAQEDTIIPSSMPLFQLMNTMLDKMSNDNAEYKKQVLEYSKTDLICYFADENDELCKIEKDTWGSIINWLNSEYRIDLKTTNGIAYIEQSSDSLNKFKDIVDGLTAYELTAIQAVVPIMGSIVIPLAILKKHMSIEDAFDAAFLDEIYQMKKWGNDPEIKKKHKEIIAEINNIYKFLELSLV